MGRDAVGEELKGRAALLGAGRQERPDAFAPSLATVATRALRDPAVDHHEANGLFGQVVRRSTPGVVRNVK